MNLEDYTMEERIEMARLADAHDQVCRACPFYIWQSQPGWQWARCWKMGVDADGIPNVELSDEVRKLGNCPEGHWDGVVGKTDAEVAADLMATHERRAREFIKQNGPLMALAADKVTLYAALDEMVHLEPPHNTESGKRDAIITQLEKAGG